MNEAIAIRMTKILTIMYLRLSKLMKLLNLIIKHYQDFIDCDFSFRKYDIQYLLILLIQLLCSEI